MKTRIPSIIAICCLAVVTPAFSQKKGTGDNSEPATQPQPAAPKAPSENLAAFLAAHLDQLLSPLDTRKSKPPEADMETHNVPVATRAEVIKRDQEFRANASAATPANQPVFQCAVAVTTSLAQLMDERDRQSSRYIDSRRRRPRKQEEWSQTATRYRQQINTQMDLLGAAERQTRAANPSGSGTPRAANTGTPPPTTTPTADAGASVPPTRPPLLAGNLTTLSGKIYVAVALKRVDPDGLLIIHMDGEAKVLFTDLPENLRIRYYSEKIAALKAAQAAEAERLAKERAAAAEKQAEQQAEKLKSERAGK